MTDPRPLPTQSNLRETAIARRTEIPAPVIAGTALAIQGHLEKLTAFQTALNVAVYYGFRSEVPIHQSVHPDAYPDKRFFLPRIENANMTFRRWTAKDRLVQNHFGILEPPIECAAIEPDQLDVVIAPLAAFDFKGSRVGMGGGFYDRTFAFRNQSDGNGDDNPLLIGVAHSAQWVPSIAKNPWDVRMDCIATEIGFIVS